MDFDEKTTDFLMKYTISDEGTKLDTAESWLARSKIIFQGLDPFKFQNLNHKMLIELCLPKTVEKVVETTMENTLAADVLFTGKDLFDPNHNASHSTLYPDVLKIKTIIVVKQKFAKTPFVYYLQIYKSISGYSAIWTS